LHEFDRFVRHELKPTAYLRYGDDFILVGLDRETCLDYRHVSEQFLNTELELPLNPRNDAIVRSRDGLHFLGHRIYENGIVIEPATEQRVKERFNTLNAANYQALHLPRRLRKQLTWMLQENIDKVLDL
jgi:RNA-directed DNA polymerase